MSHFMRMLFVVAGTFINAIQFLVFERVGTDLFAMGQAGGEYAGPFSDAMVWLETGWAVEIAILQLGLMLYLVYGPVRQERARARVSRP